MSFLLKFHAWLTFPLKHTHLMKQGIQERGTEKRTTDLKKLGVRRSLGGVAYAIHDPHAPSPQGKDEGPMPRCLFLVCPQAPLNDFEGLGELLPWVCAIDWRDITRMNAGDWEQMDHLTEAIQSGDLNFLSLDDTGFELFLRSKQYLVPQLCSDGTHIYEALLGALGTTALASPFHYRLPAKLAAWMDGGGLGSLTFKVKKSHGAWSDSKHYVWQEEERGGDPVFEKLDGDGVCTNYWFTTGSKGVPGNVNMQIGNGRPEALLVIFQQGGPIDPFLGRPLSPLVQQHLLSSQSYMMPLHRDGKTPSSPKTAVVEVPQEGDCLLDSLMVLEWEAESPQAHMKLTLWYENDDSTWWVVAFEKACQQWSKRVRIYHFLEAGRARYTYFDGDNTEMDLPAGVYESMVPRNRIRVTAGSVRSEPVPDPTGKVYCEYCFLLLNSKPQWDDHSEGKKHKAREKICKFLT